jgi:3-hydroxyisobutyrate dehydrogenase
MNVAVLGMGVMGRAMASVLAGAGVTTTVWNRHRRDADGVRVAGTVAEAVGDADVVITMLTDADAVLAVAGEMLPAMPSGAVWAQMSTIGVDGFDRAAALVTSQRPDVVLVDAPVSGSRGPAAKGELVVFASGPAAVRDRVAPVFDAVGKRTVWVGEAGQGTRMKLVNNTLLAFQAQGIAESLGLAASLGVDLPTVLDALDGSPLVSAWAAPKLDRIGRGDYSDEYSLALATKDVGLAVGEGSLPVAPHILELWRQAVGKGLGDDDLTVITRELRS